MAQLNTAVWGIFGVSWTVHYLTGIIQPMDSSNKIVRDPVYKQFKAVIKDLLLKQTRWPAGAQMSTERVLADEFKLSRVTISKALSELEAEGLIEKRPPGGTFVTEKVKSRGLVKFLFYLSDPLSRFPGYALVLSVLESRLSAKGVGLIYTSSIQDDNAPTRAIVVVGPVGDAAFGGAAMQLPTVTVDFGSFVDGTDGIEIDNVAGGQKAVEFLYEKGHRRIGYMGSFRRTEQEEWPNSARRREGCLAAMRKLKLEINPEHQCLSWADPLSGMRAAQHVLNLPNPPTALVCFSENQARGALEALRGMTPKRGRTLETVCFADGPGETPVSGLVGYCVMPWQKIADTAADLVLQRMEKPNAAPVQKVMMPEVIAAKSAH